MVKRFLQVVSTLFFIGVGGGGFVLWEMSQSLPRLEKLEDYTPPQSAIVFDIKGHRVDAFSKVRREVVHYKELPQHVVDAFIAAEDDKFFEHAGIDYMAFAAAVVNEIKYRLVGGSRRGGGTITMQTARTFITGNEKTYQRKLKEMMLARKIEAHFTKSEILSLYLNQIFFGHGAYGVDAAARTYFGKSIRDIDLNQAATLATIPKAPTRINPFSDRERCLSRRNYVLEQIHTKLGSIDASELERLKSLPLPGRRFPEKDEVGAYYVAEARRILTEALGEKALLENGYHIQLNMDSAKQAAAEHALRESLEEVQMRRGHSTTFLKTQLTLPEDTNTIQQLIQETLNERLYTSLDKPWAFRLPKNQRRQFQNNTTSHLSDYLKYASVVELSPTHAPVDGIVLSHDSKTQTSSILVGNQVCLASAQQNAWALKADGESAIAKDLSFIPVGTIVSGRTEQHEETCAFALTPRQHPEGAFVSLDSNNGVIQALVGGYSFEYSQFNRATQAWRQPGSAYKPLIYATAIAKRTYNPIGLIGDDGSHHLIVDAPKTFYDRWQKQHWKPKNAGGKFRGDISLRTCLTYSINTCSIQLLEDIGIEPVIHLAEQMELHDRDHPAPQNLTLALGTGETTPLAMISAYQVFDSAGIWNRPTLIRQVEDTAGEIVYKQETESRAVLDASAAYVTKKMMEDVVSIGTARQASLFQGISGKTGTTNAARSVWFIGILPSEVAGVFVGYDDNRPLGSREYGGKAALPAWVKYAKLTHDIAKIKEAEEDRLSYADMPEGVVARAIDKETHLLAKDPAQYNTPTGVLSKMGFLPDTSVRGPKTIPEGAYLEYFLKGTEPVQTAQDAPQVEPMEVIEGAFY